MQCNKHQLAERMQYLQSMVTWEDTHKAELEKIDTILTKILLEADKTCSPPQTDLWSPKLNQAYL